MREEFVSYLQSKNILPGDYQRVVVDSTSIVISGRRLQTFQTFEYETTMGIVPNEGITATMESQLMDTLDIASLQGVLEDTKRNNDINIQFKFDTQRSIPVRKTTTFLYENAPPPMTLEAFPSPPPSDGGGGFGDWFQGGNVTLFISLASAGAFLIVLVCLFLGATPERAEAFGKVFGSVATVVRAARGIQEKETKEDKEKAAQDTALRTIELANALGALRATPSSDAAPGSAVALQRTLAKAQTLAAPPPPPKAQTLVAVPPQAQPPQTAPPPIPDVPVTKPSILQGAKTAVASINSIARRGANAILAPPPPLTTTKDVVVVPPPRDTTFATRPSVTAACQGPDCPPDQTKKS